MGDLRKLKDLLLKGAILMAQQHARGEVPTPAINTSTIARDSEWTQSEVDVALEELVAEHVLKPWVDQAEHEFELTPSARAAHGL